ncbi:hypothetical protein AcW1_008480 [Taiwanofungus camphoratus]|nr:hypothetical protein AcV5_008771 [Antrodia cinnamomea]KAI0951437.1 hypothetical protein AcW1_008480 [Antrodia cinnamomea]KAI0956340.1 hypothetical protein AcV7_006767 [Antrodia cinnamomea]
MLILPHQAIFNMAFLVPSATLRVPTEEELRRSSPRVRFCPNTTRTAPAEHRMLRSPPPKPSRRGSSRLFRVPSPPPFALVHRSSSGKHSSRVIPEIKVIESSGRRVECDWVPIPGFKPYDYTLLDLDVAQQREDICYRAFPRSVC